MSHWYVMKVAPQREFAAAEALRDLGYQVYCASVRKKRRKGKRMVSEAKPFFPGYIFTHYWIPSRDDTDGIRDQNNRRMILGPVSIGGRCEPIPDEVIGKIAEAAARLDNELDKPRRPILKIGDIGLMKSGPFEGKQGEVVSISKGEAEIALKIFNAIRLVKAPIKALEAAA